MCVFKGVRVNEGEQMQALSVIEACQSMRIGRTKLYALIKANELPARKIGTKTIILKQDVEAYLR